MIELKKKYKSGSAVEILREAVLNGDIPEKINITQNEIALSLGISRMPVREALISLEYQGFIERRSNQHIQVTELNEEYIHSLFNDMAALEIEALKILPDEKINALSLCEGQIKFHEMLCENINAPLRKKMLEILTGIYLSFVIQSSDNINKINLVFRNLQQAMKSPADLEVIRACYAVYSEVLASELMRIRRQRKENAEFETSKINAGTRTSRGVAS